MKEWRDEAIGTLAVLFVIFEIFFYKDGLKPLIMTLSTFAFVVLPGTLVALYVFKNRFKKVETIIIGFALGIIIIPSLIYFVNIFEVMHARYLGFVIPIILNIVFGWLNFK